ncbi:hypothetical protein EJB05_35071, partial [Eragrostis curvula]
MNNNLTLIYSVGQILSVLFSPLPFSILELRIQTNGHAFGKLLLHLLQIRPTQTLVVDLACNKFPCHGWSLNINTPPILFQTSCPLDTPCDPRPNWREKSTCLVYLEVVTLYGFHGHDDEIDFLKVLLRCATDLKHMTLHVSARGYKKICIIFVNIHKA